MGREPRAGGDEGAWGRTVQGCWGGVMMGGSPGMGEVLDGWGRLFMAGGRNGGFI